MLNLKKTSAMKYLIFSLSLFLAIAEPSSAQRGNDAIILKNGSVIKGKLLEASPDSYRILTSDGSIFVFSAGEVESYNSVTTLNKTEDAAVFGLGMEAGFMVGTQVSQYVAPFGFNILGTIGLNDFHSLAIGSGVELLGASYSPLFLEYRVNLYDRPVTPFVFVRGGAVIYTGGKTEDDGSSYYNEREYSGGPTATIGTGINWNRQSYQMVLSFAFRYIRTEYSVEDYYSSESTYITNWKRLEVKLGFRF